MLIWNIFPPLLALFEISPSHLWETSLSCFLFLWNVIFFPHPPFLLLARFQFLGFGKEIIAGKVLSWSDDRGKFYSFVENRNIWRQTSLFFAEGSWNSQLLKPIIYLHFFPVLWRWVLQIMRYCTLKFFSTIPFSSAIHSSHVIVCMITCQFMVSFCDYLFFAEKCNINNPH